MLSKSKIKFVRSLQLQKYRQKYHKIVVEGAKLVREIIEQNLLPVDMVIAESPWLAANANWLRSQDIPYVEAAPRDLKSISSLKTPQPVIAVADVSQLPHDTAHPADALCFYLDGVRDPGNLGTIFRIADWFGIGSLYLSPDCAEPWNPKVIQASMGSVFRVRYRSLTVEEILQSNSCEIWCAVLDGEALGQLSPPQAGLIVLGNESRGISDEVLAHCTRRVTISSEWSLGAESLNVAVAAGVLGSFLRGD